MTLPAELAASPWSRRLDVALAAVRSAGAALLDLRGSIRGEEAGEGQLKTSTDLAAEGWVLGFLDGSFRGEPMLAEERFEQAGEPWPGRETYWTIDALDGTRSYVDGFDGFCVQVAFVERGAPVVAAIAAPAFHCTYVAAKGAGAWRLDAGGAHRLAPITEPLASGARFVDSTRPAGPVGALFDRHAGVFVECGSVGLKICRVAEGAADVYAKQFRYKLWDVAPGELLLREVGGVLSSWQGERIDYAGARVRFETVLACSDAAHRDAVSALAAPQ